MHFSKTLGCALLVTGTSIGAGMLAIPLVVAQLGFINTALLLITIWFFSYIASLLILDITCKLSPNKQTHLNRMAKEVLGRVGQGVMWICVLGLLYSLTIAYISGGSSIISALFEHQGIMLPQWIYAAVFTLILGGIVTISTRATDMCNRFLFMFKAVLLVLMLAFSLPFIDVRLLFEAGNNQKYFLIAAPVIFVSFGFHHIVPTLAQYTDFNVKLLKRILLIGSLIPLIIYLLWVVMSLGIMPRAMLEQDVGDFIYSLSEALQRPSMLWIVNGFANFAVITSFLGVTLGLFDFLRDSFNVAADHMPKRLGIAVLAFVVPFVFAITIPAGFIQLLAFGGVFFAIMAYVLPAIMALKMQLGGVVRPAAVATFGVVVAVLGVLFS